MLIKNRMQEIINGTAKAFNAKIQLNYKDGYPPVINNDLVTKKVYSAAKKIVNINISQFYMLEYLINEYT